eukprot:RCo006597
MDGSRIFSGEFPCIIYLILSQCRGHDAAPTSFFFLAFCMASCSSVCECTGLLFSLVCTPMYCAGPSRQPSQPCSSPRANLVLLSFCFSFVLVLSKPCFTTARVHCEVWVKSVQRFSEIKAPSSPSAPLHYRSTGRLANCNAFLISTSTFHGLDFGAPFVFLVTCASLSFFPLVVEGPNALSLFSKLQGTSVTCVPGGEPNHSLMRDRGACPHRPLHPPPRPVFVLRFLVSVRPLEKGPRAFSPFCVFRV